MRNNEIDSLQKICNELNQILRCPICFDTIKDLVEIRCGHKYCRKCLFKQKSTNKVSYCPICKFKINRRSILYKDEFVNLFGKFVHNVQDILQHSEKKSKQVNDPNFKEPYSSSVKETRPHEDAFDALLGSSNSGLNKKTLKRTYSNRAKELKPPLEYRILDFNDLETKEKVVKWLDDTRNKFDRLTQTQNTSEKNCNDGPIIDLPSVSQAKQLHKGIFRTRAKSLDNEVVESNNKRKRYTDGCTEILENYFIEQFSNDEEEAVERAEENVLMNLIEDEILNKFEKEIIHDAIIENDKKPPNLETTQTSLSGWDRITKIKKTLKTHDKIPAQLSIILQPVDGLVKKVSTSSKQKIKHISTGGIGLKKESHSYENVSHDISGDLEIGVSASKNDQPIAISTEQQNKKSSSDISKSDTSKKNRSHDCSNNMESVILAQQDDHHEKNGNSTNKKNTFTEERENIKLLNNNKLLDNQNEVEGNKTVLKNMHELQDDDVYLVPTQPITNLIKSQLCVTFEGENYNLSNQKFETSIDMQNIHLFEDLLNRINNILDFYSSNANAPLCNKDVELMKTCLERMNLFYSQKISHSYRLEKKDVMVQTLQQISKNITTQTYVQELQNSSTQYCVPSAHVETQTDRSNNIAQQDVNDRLKKSQVAQTSKGFPEELDYFAGTFDNFNFETQEVTKNASSKSLLTKDVLPLTSNSKIATPKSVLVCTLDNSGASDDINRRFKYTRDGPKRKRNVLDSDSEDEIISRVKHNRFKRNDLSVEFETQMGTDATKKSQLSAGSGSIDYDNYLVEVMKKYDDGELFLDKTKNNLSAKSKSTSESQKVPDSEQINKQINDNIKTIVATMRGNSVSSDSFKTSSQGNSCDIIGKTETLETVPKKIEQMKLDKSINLKSGLMDNDIFDEFNDGLEDVLLANLAKNIHAEKPRINIVQDIVISTRQQEEDVLFSDEDIVETTPQKLKRCRSKNMNHSKTEDILAYDGLDFEIEALPPPTEFQDNPENDRELTLIGKSPTTNENKENQYQRSQREISESPERIENIAVDTSSLTPDLSQYITLRSKGNNMSLKEQIKTPRAVKRAKLEHSTPSMENNVDRETLGFSPISRNENRVCLAQSTRITPLSNIPNETFKQNILTSTPKQKSMWNYVKPSKIENDCTVSNSKTKPCLACTRLSKDQIMSISQMTNKKLATYSTTFDSTVTHMIVSIDDHNCLKDYTVKSVAAIAAGIWVLRFEWVQDCLAQNAIVAEEPYEVMDCSGLPGPKTSRLTRKDKPLFQGYKFYCANPFYSTTQQDIQDVIKMLGGKVVSRLSEMSQEDDKIGLIIAEVKASQDLEVFENYLDKYKVPTVDIEWLSKSVGRYQLMSIRPFVWCSDDRLDDLNYPPFLVEHGSTASEYM